jgi:carbon-monoxide dehydrogenase small subunit
MTLTEHLRTHPQTTEAEIREVLSGNICRCTGYGGIVRAALRAAEVMRGSEGGKP